MQDRGPDFAAAEGVRDDAGVGGGGDVTQQRCVLQVEESGEAGA